MLPALWPDDVVEIASCSAQDVRPGEIVLALRDGRFFLHRLVASSTTKDFVLRGDSVPCPDPQYPVAALLGRLVRRADGMRGFSAAALRPGFGAKLSRALGMLLCHCGVARRIALKLHSRRKPSESEFRDLNHPADLGSMELG